MYTELNVARDVYGPVWTPCYNPGSPKAPSN